MQTNYLQKLLSEQGDSFKRDACGLYVNGYLMSNHERYVVIVEEADGRWHREDVFNLGALNELLRDFPSAVGFIIKWGPGWSIEVSELLAKLYWEYEESINIMSGEW